VIEGGNCLQKTKFPVLEGCDKHIYVLGKIRIGITAMLNTGSN